MRYININDDDDWYYESIRRFDNQTAVIRFYNNDSYYDSKKKKNTWMLTTVYAIGPEKQVNRWFNNEINDIDLTKSGKQGLKSIFWAKEQIKEIINIFKEEHPDDKLILQVHWVDNKRRDLYYRGLKDLGFKFNNLYGYKSLYFIYN